MTLEQIRTSVRTVIIACAAVALADFFMPAQVAIALLYIIPVLISPWAGRRRFTLGVAAACSALTAVDLALSLDFQLDIVPGNETSMRLFFSRNGWPMINAAVAVFGIWITANLSMLRVQIERELGAARKGVETILHSIVDPVITTDERGLVSYLNGAAEELLGRGRDECLGLPLDKIVDWMEPSMQDSAVLQRLPEERGEPRCLRRRDGLEVYVDVRSAPIGDAPGQELHGPHGPSLKQGRVYVFRDITERSKYERLIKRLAYRDPLTGLPNRTSLWDRLELEVAHARRGDTLLALLFLDLDKFKQVNDTMGHRAGDELLRQVAKRLQVTLREGDTVARLAGDEFTVLLPELKDVGDAALVAEKIVDAFVRPFSVDGRDLWVRPSIGVAVFPGDAEDADSLLQRADEAMYQSKERGGNTWSCAI